MDLADKIKQIREEKRMSQAEIARALQLDPAAYFRLEKRGKKLSLEQLESIAAVLGVSLLSLLSEDSTEIPKAAEETDQLHLRIKELEDRINDKQFIINKLTEEKESTIELIDQFIEDLKSEVGTDLKLGTVYYQDEQGNQQSMPWADFESLSFEETMKIEDSPGFDVTESEADKAVIIEAMFSDERYVFATRVIMNTGYVRDKELLKAYEKHYEHMYKWMNQFTQDRIKKINPALSKILKAKSRY